MKYAILRIREGREGAEAYSLAFLSEAGGEPVFELYFSAEMIDPSQLVALARNTTSENTVEFGIELI